MISILLASYNGEKYIAEQIDSVLNQTEQNFFLYINDDCSTDRTYEIEKEYESRYPDRIKVTQNDKNSGSAKFNFMNMMIKYKDDYVMLCDQDDAWLPEKIEITLKKMYSMEKMYGKDTPILVHTDLKVVDEDLNLISESFAKRMNADYSKTEFKNQIVQNTLTGCTAMYNRRLSVFLKGNPDFMVMHDWWLMLVASAFGEIGSEYTPTILYRQHSGNVIGTRNMKSLIFMAKFFANRKRIKEALDGSYKQAAAFLREYKDMLDGKALKTAYEYSNIVNKGKLWRVLAIFRLGTLKNGLFRKIAQIIYI